MVQVTELKLILKIVMTIVSSILGVLAETENIKK
jgi:hypothetical protein